MTSNDLSRPVIVGRTGSIWSAGHTLARSVGYGSVLGALLGFLVCCATGAVGYAGFGMIVGFLVGAAFGLVGGLLLVALGRWLLRWPIGIPVVSGGSSAVLGFVLTRSAYVGLGAGSHLAATLGVLALVGGLAGPRVFFGKRGLRELLVRWGVRRPVVIPR